MSISEEYREKREEYHKVARNILEDVFCDACVNLPGCFKNAVHLLGYHLFKYPSYSFYNTVCEADYIFDKYIWREGAYLTYKERNRIKNHLAKAMKDYREEEK